MAHWVHVKCEFGCPDYGLGSCSCPPNIPSVEDCGKFFKEYQSGIIIRLSKMADKDAYPSDWSQEMTRKLLKVKHYIFVSGHQKVLLLNQTCCTLCKEYSGMRLDCKNKRDSHPSPESFAVNVYQTVRNAGMEINVVAENPSAMNRIAILLIE